MYFLLISFFLGLLSCQKFPEIKLIFSKFMVYFIIPCLIVWNVNHLSLDGESLFISTFTISTLIYGVCQFWYKDKVKALSYSYLNLGIIGYPFLMYYLGQEVSDSALTCFSASACSGAFLGFYSFMSGKSMESNTIKKFVLSPPVLAFSTALWFKLGGVPFSSELEQLYLMCKKALPILGFFVLGAWLRTTNVFPFSLVSEFKVIFRRCAIYYFCSAVILSLFYSVLHFHYSLINLEVLLLIPILPSATNIVVMETHYNNTGNTSCAVGRSSVASIMILLFLIGSKEIFIG